MRLTDTITIAILAAILPATLTAATDGGSEQIKNVPLVGEPVAGRAPEFASWTITFDYPSLAQQESKARKRAPRRIASIAVTKTKDTYCEQIRYEDNSQREIWTIGDLRVQPDGSGRLCICAPDSMSSGAEGTTDPEEALSADGILVFKKTDFPDFQWLSKQNFAGLQKDNAAGHLVFEGTAGTSFTGTGITGLPLTALVDGKSRLPSEIRCKEWTMAFEFGPAPENTLAPPHAVQELLNQRDQQMKDSTKRNPSI